jgi:hypothetical protein
MNDDAFFSLIALAESLGVEMEAVLQSALIKDEARLAMNGHSGSRADPNPC